MNKRTRVLNALDGKATDRVPASFWHHFSGEDAIGDKCVQAHINYYKETDVDFIKIMSDGFDWEPPVKVQTIWDWNQYKPLGRHSWFIEGQLERAKRINEALKGECCTFYNVFAPFSLVRHAVSDVLVMTHLRENKSAVLSAVEAIAEDAALLARLLVTEGGCTGIYLPLQGGERDRFTYDEYRKMIMPSDLMVLNAANEVSDYNIAHLCGWAGDRNSLDIWRDYPAKAFNWSISTDELSLVDGKMFFGGKTIMGGFDNRKCGVLFSGSEDEIKCAVKEIIGKYNDKFGSCTGLILGADCTVSADIDLSHIRCVMKTLDEMSDM